MKFTFLNIFCVLIFTSCGNYFKNDHEDNSPTSGKLNVFYDENLKLHITNQVATFESQYPDVEIFLTASSEAEAVQALYNDSCKAIVISRPLNESEIKSFASKKFNPQYSLVAYSGIALITGKNTNIGALSLQQIKSMLTSSLSVKDSLGNIINLNAVIDGNNTSTMSYIKDSIAGGKEFSATCSAAKNTLDLFEYIAQQNNAIGFFNFAWLSDKDDSLYKQYSAKIKFIAVGRGDGKYFEPNQSSFKTGEYPLRRGVYVYRNTGDFTLAKGFESFVAGPKGQTTFLKQGLLPSKQQERSVTVAMEPLKVN